MYRGQKYYPSGFVSGHPYIKHVDSISDLISKIIDIELGNFDHCQVKPDADEVASNSAPPAALIKPQYDESDYIHGETCGHCHGAKMVKNGTCKVCAECGTTTGCS
jgi:ribonucleoside-diphosphate reductase alpha chain